MLILLYLDTMSTYYDPDVRGSTRLPFCIAVLSRFRSARVQRRAL